MRSDQRGSRAAERFLFKVPPAIAILSVRNDLHSVFRDALIADYSEAHPLIEQGLRQSTTFLSLVSLIALVIGAFSGHGVALSVYLGNWAARVLLGRKKLPKWKITAE